MKRTWLLCFCLVLGLAVLAKSQDTDTLTLGKGQGKTYTVGDPSGCFVDNTSILSLRTTGDDQIKVTALQPGRCTLTLPGKAGRNRYIGVTVINAVQDQQGTNTVPSPKSSTVDIGQGTLDRITIQSQRNHRSTRTNNNGGVRARVKVAGVDLSTNLGLASAPTPVSTPVQTMLRYQIQLAQIDLGKVENAGMPLEQTGVFEPAAFRGRMDLLIRDGYARQLDNPALLVENSDPAGPDKPSSATLLNGSKLTLQATLLTGNRIENKIDLELLAPEQFSGEATAYKGSVVCKLGETVVLTSHIYTRHRPNVWGVPYISWLSWDFGHDEKSYILVYLTPALAAYTPPTKKP